MDKTDTNLQNTYDNLTPELILDAVDSFGLVTNAQLLALNSYENRVYQVGVDAARPVVAKFYRPDRWTDESILEEHQFTLELESLEIPAVPPLASPDGSTLNRHGGYRFALFPSRGGRSPELDDEDHMIRIGRFLGRIHLAGSSRCFEHRTSLSIETFGYDSVKFLTDNSFIPPEMRREYDEVTHKCLTLIGETFKSLGDTPSIRLHGDCHPGNILWTDSGPHFVDFDDCINGPAIQDLWMLLSGSWAEMMEQLGIILEGYEEFHTFNFRETRLIEPLRTLRILNYSAWLAKRWSDPAFPMNFPWFNTLKYWQEQMEILREQYHKLENPGSLNNYQ